MYGYSDGILGIDFTNVMLSPSIMALTPDHMMGKVGGLANTLAICAAPLGQFVYGLLFDHLHVSAIMAGTAICLSLMAVALAPAARSLSTALNLPNTTSHTSPTS